MERLKSITKMKRFWAALAVSVLTFLHLMGIPLPITPGQLHEMLTRPAPVVESLPSTPTTTEATP